VLDRLDLGVGTTHRTMEALAENLLAAAENRTHQGVGADRTLPLLGQTDGPGKVETVEVRG
jgi:hypothetical protein